jgi:hypothetical protein
MAKIAQIPASFPYIWVVSVTYSGRIRNIVTVTVGHRLGALLIWELATILTNATHAAATRTTTPTALRSIPLDHELE